jgi:hypothetical protein
LGEVVASGFAVASVASDFAALSSFGFATVEGLRVGFFLTRLCGTAAVITGCGVVKPLALSCF